MRKSLVSLTLTLVATFTLPGCANTPPKLTQSVPKAMLQVPPRPVSPSQDDVSQRDVALYIVLLRSWGDGMATQLRAIDALVHPKED